MNTDDFRAALLNNMHAVAKAKPREWNEALLAITEGRRSGDYRYNWSGDLVATLLARAGAKARCLNLRAVSGSHSAGNTVDMLCAWAGDPEALKAVGQLLGPEVTQGNWHAAKDDKCTDGYVPKCGDVLVHEDGNAEMVVEVTDKGICVLAPMVFAEAKFIRRNFGHFQLAGVIDVAVLAPKAAEEAPADPPSLAPKAPRRKRKAKLSEQPAAPTNETTEL